MSKKTKKSALERETARNAPALAAAPAPQTAPAPVEPVHVPSDIVATEDNPSRSIVPKRFKAKYSQHGGSCGDEVAFAIKNAIEVVNADGRKVLSMAALEELAKANGINFDAYRGLNNGQKSMNVRNKLRGMLKAGKTILVGKVEFGKSALVVRPVEPKPAKVEQTAPTA